MILPIGLQRPSLTRLSHSLSQLPPRDAQRASTCPTLTPRNPRRTQRRYSVRPHASLKARSAQEQTHSPVPDGGAASSSRTLSRSLSSRPNSGSWATVNTSNANHYSTLDKSFPPPVALHMASVHSGPFAKMTFIPPPSSHHTRPASPTPDAIVLQEIDKRGYGALSETYTVDIHHSGSVSPAIFKTSDIERFRERNDFTMEDARDAILKEAVVYRQLGDCGLQGKIVPRYWGVGALYPPGGDLKDCSCLCSVMEDAGKPMPEELKRDPDIR